MKYATPVTNTLNNHVTIRFYNGEPIPEEMLTTILEAARRSPTSSNMQTYSIIVVRDPQTRKELARIANNQKHIETCEVFIAFCADIHRLETVAQIHGVEMATNLETTLVSSIDAALVGMSVQTAAESFGLGGVMIGAIRNDPQAAADLLGLPKGVYVVYGMCLGWPDPERLPPQKPRLPADLVIHHERYDQRSQEEGIRAYDTALAAHYDSLGSNTDEAAWSGPIARRLENPPRPLLRATLEAMGFSVD